MLNLLKINENLKKQINETQPDLYVRSNSIYVDGNRECGIFDIFKFKKHLKHVDNGDIF